MQPIETLPIELGDPVDPSELKLGTVVWVVKHQAVQGEAVYSRARISTPKVSPLIGFIFEKSDDPNAPQKVTLFQKNFNPADHRTYQSTQREAIPAQYPPDGLSYHGDAYSIYPHDGPINTIEWAFQIDEMPLTIDR